MATPYERMRGHLSGYLISNIEKFEMKLQGSEYGSLYAKTQSLKTLAFAY